MMEYLRIKLSFIILLSIFLKSNAQKNDNIWELSRPYTFSNPTSYYLDFNNGYPDTIVQQNKMTFFLANSTISDSSGMLQYYTNGIWIANKNNDTLLNSQNFNPGTITSNYQNTGLPITQSLISLPFYNDSLIYLIHESAENFNNSAGEFDTQPLSLKYSLIDMSLDNGNGGMVLSSKNITIINDTILFGCLTACKHANGRDWWLIAHKYYSNTYYKLLFTPEGVFGPYTQNIGQVLLPKWNNDNNDYDVFGMASFSPDGTKYAMVGSNKMIEFLNFDRCSGLFNNYNLIQIPDTNTISTGCSFSPNCRFLYANTLKNAYQFDTDASNIQSSVINIAQYDSFTNPTPTWFLLNQLGPDGKIYLSTYNYTRKLHVIHNPDSVGVACNFLQHGFSLPPYLAGNVTIPNFPNYRLSNLPGSPCDSLMLTLENEYNKIKIELYPNPNEGDFIFKYLLPIDKNSVLEFYDQRGKVILSQVLPKWSTVQYYNLKTFNPGMYVAKISSGENYSFIKFIIK